MTWDDIKAFLGVAAIIASVLVLALVEILRRKFASLHALGRLEKRVTELERHEELMPDRIEKAVHKAVGALAESLNRDFIQLRREIEQYQVIALGNNDKLAEHHARIQRNEDKMAVMDQYGSKQSAALKDSLGKLTRKIDRISIKLGVDDD